MRKRINVHVNHVTSLMTLLLPGANSLHSPFTGPFLNHPYLKHPSLYRPSLPVRARSAPRGPVERPRVPPGRALVPRPEGTPGSCVQPPALGPRGRGGPRAGAGRGRRTVPRFARGLTIRNTKNIACLGPPYPDRVRQRDGAPPPWNFPVAGEGRRRRPGGPGAAGVEARPRWARGFGPRGFALRRPSGGALPRARVPRAPCTAPSGRPSFSPDARP